MPVYYEVIAGVIYVCNRRSNVRMPLTSVTNIGLSWDQCASVAEGLNSAYKAGYQTALNQVRATVDQMEVRDAALKASTN